MSPSGVSFSLVVATVDRERELHALLGSVATQTHPVHEIVVVDQNADDRVTRVLAEYPALPAHAVKAPRGLSRARNIGLAHVTGDVVAFPDDDCAYPPDLLERVAGTLAATPALAGLGGRTADRDGRSSPSWPRTTFRVTRARVWNAGCSASLFLRRSLVERVGPFDERLGLGAGTETAAGEEIDYLLRALETGAWIDYDPSVVVWHPIREPDAAALKNLGRRDGATVGYLMRKHGFGPGMLTRMAVRPAAGLVVALARGDRGRAGYQAETLRGRLRGYRLGAS